MHAGTIFHADIKKVKYFSGKSDGPNLENKFSISIATYRRGRIISTINVFYPTSRGKLAIDGE